MIPVLFKEDEQIFTHNGIGALYESLSCDVIEEENGAFTMELEYPVDGELFSEIKDFRIIQAKPNDIDDPHNFRIYEIEKSIDELTVYVRANTRTNDLGNNLITNYIGKDVTPQQAMNGIKTNLIEPTNFDLISDIQTKSNVEWTRLNPLSAVVGVRGSLVDIWGGQIKRTNTAIHLYSRRGRDNVVTIRPGKNIEGLNMTVSTAGLVTKILPTFTYRPVDVPEYQMVELTDGTTEKRRVSTSGGTVLRDDITVLGDVVTSQYVDNYPNNYWSSVDYGDDSGLSDVINGYIDDRLTEAEESPTIVDMSGFEDDLKDFVKTELDKKAKQYFTHRNPTVDKPTVRIKVDMLQLSDSPDWEEFKDLEQIGLTDTLDVWVEEYDIDVEVRVTSLTYDSIAEQVRSFDAGSDRAPRQSSIEKKYDDLTKATNDYITSFKNGVQNVMRNTADGLNRKFEGYTEPPARLSSEGDIWFKEIGEGKVEIWIHDGVYWQPLMTEDFGRKLESDMEAIDAELEEAKRKAKLDSEEALVSAKAHADAEVNRINTQLTTEIGGAIDLAAQAKQTAIDRANEAYNDAVVEADRLAAIRDDGITIEAGQITAGVIDAARLDALSIVTNGLTANVIKSTHIETSTATIDKLFADETMINRLTSKTAFIDNIKAVEIDASKITSGTIKSARIDATDIVTQGLTSDIIKSNHIMASSALFDKLFSTNFATDRLRAREAWVTNGMFVEASIDGAVIQDATIGSAKIASLDVDKLSGNKANFVTVGFNSISSNLTIDSSGLTINSASSWDMELVNQGIAITNKYGTHTGKFTALINTTTKEPSSLGVVAENGFDTILGYRGTHSNTGTTWSSAVRVNGTSGDISLQNNLRISGDSIRMATQTIYPNWTSNESFYFNSVSGGGVTLRNSNGDAGFTLYNNGEVRIVGGSPATLIVPEIKPYADSHTRIRLSNGTVSGNEGIWIRDHTSSSGIFLARSGDLYIGLNGVVYNMRTVLSNSGYPGA